VGYNRLCRLRLVTTAAAKVVAAALFVLGGLRKTRELGKRVEDVKASPKRKAPLAEREARACSVGCVWLRGSSTRPSSSLGRMWQLRSWPIGGLTRSSCLWGRMGER